MGTHIREFRKVTAAIPHSREPCAGLAGGSLQPKGCRSLAGRLDAALGERYSRRLLDSGSQKEALSSARKAAAVTQGQRRCSL